MTTIATGDLLEAADVTPPADGVATIRVTSKAQNEILLSLAEKIGTIREAAREIGVTAHTLSGWINFRHQPSTHTMSKRPRYRHVILKLEKLTGRSFIDIFPHLPKDAKRFLATKRIVTKEVSCSDIQRVVEKERLSYEVDATASLERNEKKNSINAVLKTLSYREREIIKLRYGLGGDGGGLTLEEVGHIFKVTRERIREIEAKAIRKLQQPDRASEVVAFAPELTPNLADIDEDFKRKSKMSLAELVKERSGALPR